MPNRDGYIPGVPCWVDASLPEPGAALDFYSGLFGWEFSNRMPEGDPQGQYYVAQLGDGDVAAIGSIAEGAPPIPMWNTYVAVESADETAAKVRDAGGTVAMEPFDIPGAGRMAVFADPEGAVFCVWQAGEHRGATVVNEHGALNFNGLETRDADGARAFYGAVFGWTTLDLGGGAQMWTLPGYGDHLESLQPGLRDQIAAVGGPPGFEDVVASLNPIADDQPDVPAHWSVTFGADDARATAARAAELGGTVLMEPMDVPWSRMTVLRDPQGATFIASQFVPDNKDLGGD
jgi:uncharacterized protein